MNLPKSIYQKIARVLKKGNYYLIRSLLYAPEEMKLNVNLDYVRYASLELCAQEIKKANVPGALAELGVYKGDFAMRLNMLFPDRDLFLFDTFEGFDEKDKAIDRNKDFSQATQMFSDTNASQVLSKMKHPGKCIIRKGYFPDTASGLEESFAFVSIDADLYEPVLNGLKYFYPRLAKGGYIFVHDFNNKEYKGSREAVTRFCKEHSIAYVPLPDIGGTVVIGK